MHVIKRFAPVCLALSAHFGTATADAQETPFADGVLLALSDGAMVASGYIDGRLGPRKPDLLSVLLPDGGKASAWRRVDLEVSNSVARWPNTMAVSADGRLAIVTEPFGQPSAAATTFADIPPGQGITVIDLRTPGTPRIAQRLRAPGSPAAVDIHPGGQFVAVTLAESGRVALYPLADGRLGAPTLHDLPLAADGAGLPLEFKWHPSGDFAAVTLAAADRVVFLEFADGGFDLWGEPLRTAPLPGKGAWTPDGRHFIVTTITATPDMAQAAYARNASLFAVFRFDADATPNSPPRRADDRSTVYQSRSVQHARVAHVPAGMGYVENFALSPDGAWLVGANMAASWLPKGHPGRTDFSELTVFAIEPETGALVARATRQLPGTILPQGIVFDSSGRHLAVTSFQSGDGAAGSLAFYRIEHGDNVVLEPVGRPQAMPRGVHDLLFIAHRG